MFYYTCIVVLVNSDAVNMPAVIKNLESCYPVQCGKMVHFIRVSVHDRHFNSQFSLNFFQLKTL